MSIKHQKALDLSYKIGRECAFSFMSDPDLASISLESMLGILTAGWYTNCLYSVLNIYAPVMKTYVANSDKPVEEIIPRSAEWLENYQNGIRDEWHDKQLIKTNNIIKNDNRHKENRKNS